MPKTLIKSRLLSDKHKLKSKQAIKKTESNSFPHLQPFKQELLSGNGFVEHKLFFYGINVFGRFSIIR